MADNTLTLADFITAVREHADIESETDRHPDAELVRFINREWRLLRTLVTNAGFSYFITPTDTGTLLTLPTSPPYSGAKYLEIDFPTGAVGVYGVDINYNGDWRPAKPVSFASRRDYVSDSSLPHRYCVRSVAVENTTSVDAGKIMLFPDTTTAHEYIVWYLPVWNDIAAANTTYVFYGHDIWFEYAIQGVVRRVAQKDDDAHNTLAEAVRRQTELKAEIIKSVQNMNLAEPIQIRRRQRRGGRYR